MILIKFEDLGLYFRSLKRCRGGIEGVGKCSFGVIDFKIS